MPGKRPGCRLPTSLPCHGHTWSNACLASRCSNTPLPAGAEVGRKCVPLNSADMERSSKSDLGMFLK
jgi:hypothetical protein